MDSNEFQAFITTIQNMYGDRFPTLAPGMAKFWYESLRYHETDHVEQALYRWARHHTLKAPSLDELQEQIEFVKDEERASTMRQGSSSKGYAEVLSDAAEAAAQNLERGDDDVTYGRLMALLAARSIEPWFDSQGRHHPKLTVAQRGEQCQLWARKYDATRPQLATDLRYAAAKYFGGVMYMGGTAPNNDRDETQERYV